jgi:hypothetical protein
MLHQHILSTNLVEGWIMGTFVVSSFKYSLLHALGLIHQIPLTPVGKIVAIIFGQ